MSELGIGALARASGCKIPTIRYYEDIGIMPPARRSAGNQRRYGPSHIARLHFVRHGRELGFSLDSIRELLALSDDPDRSCEQADAIAKRQLIEVARRIDSLLTLRVELERMIEQCRGGAIRDCRIIEALSADGGT